MQTTEHLLLRRKWILFSDINVHICASFYFAIHFMAWTKTFWETFFSTHTRKLKWNNVSWSDSWFFINQKAPQFQWCWFANPPFWGRSLKKFCSKTDVWLDLLGLIYNISNHTQTEWGIYSSHCLKVRYRVVGRGDKYCSVYCRQGCDVVLPSLEV